MDGPQTFVLASQLSRVLCAKVVERIDVPEGRWQANVVLLNCAGQVIQRVRSHGKWLFFDFSHGVSWACYLLGRAKWEVCDEGEEEGRGKKGAGREPLLRVHLRGGVKASLMGRPLFLILPTAGVFQHEELKELGPDPLLAGDFVEAFGVRLRGAAGRTVASALLDQTIVAGVGNAMKSELLFALKMAPGVRVGSLLASQVDEVGGVVLDVLRKEAEVLGKGKPFLYRVYDRADEPCVVCKTPITVDRSGHDGHWTWYCVKCQERKEGTTLFSGEGVGVV